MKKAPLARGFFGKVCFYIKRMMAPATTIAISASNRSHWAKIFFNIANAPFPSFTKLHSLCDRRWQNMLYIAYKRVAEYARNGELATIPHVFYAILFYIRF